MTEQEQIEQLKNWIKQYGMTVVAGVVLALIIVASWHYWEDRKNRILTHASSIYDEMLTLRAQNDAKGAITQANKLIEHYKNTPYSNMAALLLARDLSIKKDYPNAIAQLNWVIKNTHNAAIRSIAKIRIARILLADKKATEALDTLKKIDDANFNGLADETRGDAFLSMNDVNKAKASYLLALQELPKDETTRRPILQMKLENLATTADNAA
jgi:predicted negative regulator of RcsB-dependent stress response